MQNKRMHRTLNRLKWKVLRYWEARRISSHVFSKSCPVRVISHANPALERSFAYFLEHKRHAAPQGQQAAGCRCVVLLYSHQKMGWRGFIAKLKFTTALGKKFIVSAHEGITRGSVCGRIETGVVRRIIRVLERITIEDERRTTNEKVRQTLASQNDGNELIGKPTRVEITTWPQKIFYNTERAVFEKEALTLSESALSSYFSRIYHADYHGLPYTDQEIDWTVHIGGYKEERISMMQAVSIKLPQSAEQGLTVLDYGCGNGELASALHELGFKSWGIEYSDACVENASRSFHGPKYIQGDLSAISSLGVKFDLIVLSHVLEHLVDDVSTLRSLSDHLSADGAIYVEIPLVTIDTVEQRPFWYRQDDHLREYTIEGFNKAAQLAGLDVEAQQALPSSSGATYLASKLRRRSV